MLKSNGSLPVIVQNSGGNDAAVAKQHAAGKLTARERVDFLFDADSFIEIEPNSTARITDLNISPRMEPGDGVISGCGTIRGRQVCAAVQDFPVMGGSLGEVHARKIKKALSLAMKSGIPFIYIIDSAGFRIGEGLDALAEFSGFLSLFSQASGVIPLITVVSGPCIGSAALPAALSDFVFMSGAGSFVCMTSAPVIRAVTGETSSDEAIGGREAQMAAGFAHFIGDTEEETLANVQTLLSYLPDNHMSDPELTDGSESGSLDDSILSSGSVTDMVPVLKGLSDGGEWFEVQSGYAPGLITGFARLGGYAAGFVANQPAVDQGLLDGRAAAKAARFVRFCDAFNIPLITVCDTAGVKAGTDQERSGIVLQMAKLTYALAEATIPRIGLVTGKINGIAQLVLNSRQTGADMIFAWPSAALGILPDETAVSILYRDKLASADEYKEERLLKLKEYQDSVSGPMAAAYGGHIDEVIPPSRTRNRIIAALQILRGKQENRPAKKHDNIPL
ncbi:MAG TPA: methylmalonyl-CoA carboxyltransferase [Clostridiales bacterium]|nr:methylmalonyl-CoA carboxyltransferase [Clostridiales bacterium]